MTEWFEEWFGEDYLRLYPHRDDAEAERAIALIRRTLPFRPGWRVLDVACGAGRHLRALVEGGARSTGVDLSAPLLRLARKVTSAPLVRADMRQLPIRPSSMDLTVNLFTSFGYFEHDSEHTGALQEMVSTVRSGGWFVIDFLNPDAVRRSLVPEEKVELEGAMVEVSRSVSPDGRYVCKRIRAPHGKQYSERVRLFEPSQMSSMLEGAGVEVRFSFGDYDAGPLHSHSPRTILMGQVT
ncbi:MAG TPA: class I SAM-dependent methyltransferase [Gemmatimonadales bacterium]|jgi:SAM-dependent methyltransferase|nr:class I SAM-dependent methyltransferase [Gemmatimonadales bacterium]